MTKPAMIRKEEATVLLTLGSRRVLIKRGSWMVRFGCARENLMTTISM